MDIRIQFILAFLEEKIDPDVDLSELADLISLSESRLRHLFTSETGKSPSQHLRDIRLARAKKLLAETRLTIDQVAMRVGWQDRSHFERRFKEEFGLTPAEHRKSCGMKLQLIEPSHINALATLAIR